MGHIYVCIYSHFMKRRKWKREAMHDSTTFNGEQE